MTKPSARFRKLAAAAPSIAVRWLRPLSRLRLLHASRRDRPRVLALGRELDELGARLAHLSPSSNLESQARFALGLYQQRQALAVRS